MAYSGTVTFRPTATQIITDALAQVGGIDIESGGTPSANQSTQCLRIMNMLLKTWGTRGIQLWERKWGVVFPQLNQGLYVLGSPGPAGDHACLSTPLNGGFVQTTTTAAAASGATTIDVTSITGQLSTVGNTAVSITNGYNIGVQLDDGTIQWTTVNGAPVGTTVTLTAALTDDVTAGNYVYCYQTKLIRPLRVVAGFIRQLGGGSDTPCRIISRDEYNMFGQKASTGTPVQLYYDNQRDAGNLYTYPIFSSTSQLLFVQFERPIDDLVATTGEDFDMPQEWGEALMWNLAWRLCPQYEVPKVKKDMIQELAIFTYEMVDGWDQEVASIQMQPDYTMFMGN